MRLRWVWPAIKVLLLGLLGIAAAAVLILSYAPHIARSGLSRLGGISEIGSAMLAPPLLAYRASRKCAWLEQNWSDDDRAWFHNVSQGTTTFPMPYAWFQKLERPELSPFELFSAHEPISDPTYLERLGFIASNADCDPGNAPARPEGYGALPVGFAVLKGGTDPVTGTETEDGLGLTCAACHTGRVFYKDTELRIDGAPAMIDTGNLERVIGLSICYGNILPWRSRRLVDSLVESQGISEASARDAARKRIANQLEAICNEKIWEKTSIEKGVLARRGETHTEEGFGRLDALNRIGNQVFHENLLPQKKATDAGTEQEKAKEAEAIVALDANFAAHNAPVSFPAIWDVPLFVWAQYDASILNPGIRNIGEALGVSARVNMLNSTDPSLPLFASSVDFEAIEKIEILLRGEKSPFEDEIGFKGLRAPRWEDAASHFPDDDNWKLAPEEEIRAGRELYSTLCSACHHAPPRDSTIPIDGPASFWNRKNWPLVADELLFDNKQIPVAAIGTDPEQARVLTARTIKLPAYLGVDTRALMKECGMQPDSALEKAYVLGLMDVVAKVREQYIRQREIRARFEATAEPTYVARPHYRARPLDGIWATAPYLHNGSVPTLDDLLSPQHERPKAFCVGPGQFDTKRVGLTTSPSTETEADCDTGLTFFDVTRRGNSNLGHAFEGDGTTLSNGVIGPLLTPEQRAQLIAYLKTL